MIRKIVKPYYFLLKIYLNILLLLRPKRTVYKVAFFTLSIDYWKYDSLYVAMKKHPRFKPIIVPITTEYWTKEVCQEKLQQQFLFFKEKQYDVINPLSTNYSVEDEIRKINPDFAFYTQPYSGWWSGDLPIKYLKHAKICYHPYYFNTIIHEASYNTMIQNLAWRVFYFSNYYKEIAQKMAYNHGANVRVTGYLLADSFLSTSINIDPWKKNSQLKRIVWAPHHSIFDNGMTNYSTFLQYCDFMLDLAHKYRDKIQIAFKPHPALKAKLYDHSNWGKEKIEAYYAQWNFMENTMLVESSYVDLFKTSDALIHDCGSFMVEYHYTKKPVLYLDNGGYSKKMDHLGTSAFEAHYHAYSTTDILHFIDDVVLCGIDPLQKLRTKFFEENLLPPNNQTVANNIINELLSSK